MSRLALGFISDLSDQDFAFAAEEGFGFLDYNINAPDIEYFLQDLPRIRANMDRYGMPISALGRFGRERLTGSSEDLEKEDRNTRTLIDVCQALEVKTLVLGAGAGDGMTFDEKCQKAIATLQSLASYARPRGVTLAVYNCRWANFIYGPDAWQRVFEAVPELGLKYDPSHAVYDGCDYLKETRDWGHKIVHAHAKGTLIIDGEPLEDPPAGLDQTNWGAFLAVLYSRNYQGDLSIEPHARTWMGSRYYAGIRIAANHLRPLMVEYNRR